MNSDDQLYLMFLSFYDNFIDFIFYYSSSVCVCVLSTF